MQQEQTGILEATPEGKIYSLKAITLVTFFGGIFAGAYLIAGNFKTMGDTRRVGATWLYAVLFFIALMATAFIPALDKIPNLVYSFIITMAVAMYARKNQESYLNDHMQNGGEVHTTGRSVAIAVIGLLITVAIILLAAWWSDQYVSTE